MQVIRVQRRMLLEQRAVIERLSCKLGKDTEDLELQFSAAVAKVMAKVMTVIMLFVNERMVNGLKFSHLYIFFSCPLTI